jgi:cation transport ATPase
VQPVTGVDLLTRTTLQIDGSMSAVSVSQVTQALRRVPGVLLAEIHATSGRATVAHDFAVQATSLLAAATRAGVHAEIVADTPAPAIGVDLAARLRLIRIRQFAIVCAAALLAPALINAIVPDAAARYWVLPTLLYVCWGFFFTRAMFDRRR